MRSGLYALVSLDGAPIMPEDCAHLHLPAPTDSGQGLALRALDAPDSRAIHIDTTDGSMAILLGHLDDAQELTAAFGLARDTSPAALAALAHERFGDGAPSRLAGEWSYLCWRPAERRLVLMASETCRDPLFYAMRGNRLAIAPDLRALSRVAWVGRALDPDGLLLHMGRAPLRRGLTTETILNGTRRVAGGTVVTIAADRLSASSPGPLPTPARWRGSFHDAMAEIEALLLRIVGQTLERHRRPAGLLSGGLDSSLLGYLASRSLSPGQTMAFLSSAAAPDSGVPDETAYAASVADRLGIPMDRVVPSRQPGVLRPSLRWMANATSPAATPAHYLYDALYDAALGRGADLLLDGVIGEATVSSIEQPDTLMHTVRTFARTAKRRLLAQPASQAEEPIDSGNPFHTRIAPDLRRSMPAWMERFAGEPSPASSGSTPRPPSELFGYARAVYKSASTPTEAVDQALRVAMPFRDRRLVRLFAGMPVSFVERHGLTRAPARAILKGHVSNDVRRRIGGMPFAPDYDGRLIHDIADARRRIAVFRAAEIGSWLDLDWLETALGRMSPAQSNNLDHCFQLALTTIAAEYLLWWQTG